VGGWLEEFLWFDVLYPNLYQTEDLWPVKLDCKT
jgi:hypothetical protein